MHRGVIIFSQTMDFLLLCELHRWAQRSRKNYTTKSIACVDRSICMAYAHLTYRENLHNIHVYLGAVPTTWCHRGIEGDVCHHMFVDANEKHNKRIIKIIDYRMHDINLPYELIPESAFFSILDRDSVGLSSLYILAPCEAFFFPHSEFTPQFRGLYAYQVNKSTGVTCDQPIVIKDVRSSKQSLPKLQGMEYDDPENIHMLFFLTYTITLFTFSSALLYTHDGHIELLYKWVTRLLRLKSLYTQSEDASKSHIWITLSIYLLFSLMKVHPDLASSLPTILKIENVSICEKTLIFLVLNKNTRLRGKSVIGNYYVSYNRTGVIIPIKRRSDLLYMG